MKNTLANAGLMLAHRLQQLANIDPALAQIAAQAG